MEEHYFGTGGLIRAYSDTLNLAIENATLVKKICGYEYEVCLDYNDLDIFKYYCKNKEISIKETKYLENVVCKITVDSKQKEILIADYVEKKIKINELGYIDKKYITKSI